MLVWTLARALVKEPPSLRHHVVRKVADARGGWVDVRPTRYTLMLHDVSAQPRLFVNVVFRVE